MVRVLRAVFLLAVALLLPVGLLVSLPGRGLAANGVVDVADARFQPANVTVEVGDQVTWRWVGQGRHSVISQGDGGFGSHPDCSLLNSGACGGPGTTFAHTFTQTGTFTYWCQVHSLLGMTGTVTVVPGSTPTPSPTPSPEATEPAPTESTRAPTSEPTTSEPSPPPTLTGPPPPMQTEPLPVIEGEVEVPSVAPTEAPSIEFEPFVEEPELPTPSSTIDVVVESVGPGATKRVLGIVVALLLLGGWTLFFAREVLFGAPWELGSLGPASDRPDGCPQAAPAAGFDVPRRA